MMKIITCYLTLETLRDLDALVKSGRFPNRSEAVRCAIRDLLKEEQALQSASEQKKLHLDIRDFRKEIKHID